jgi:diketogulonate reductase-like aldo/keto reductase
LARPYETSGLDRSDVFVETKIWISDYGYKKTLHGFEKSAGKLDVEQIDLDRLTRGECGVLAIRYTMRSM